MPIVPMLTVFFIVGMGKGLAWYWCELTSQVLTDNLINFSTATIALFIVTDYVWIKLQKYAEEKTRDDPKKQSRLKCQLLGLFIVILIVTGALVLELVQLF